MNSAFSVAPFLQSEAAALSVGGIVDQEKVRAFKFLIDKGLYQPCAEAYADKMIRHHALLAGLIPSFCGKKAVKV